MGVLSAIKALLFGVLAFFIRKSGKDAVRAESAEKTIEQIVEANRPITADERADVVRKYRRD